MTLKRQLVLLFVAILTIGLAVWIAIQQGWIVVIEKMSAGPGP